MQNELYTTLTPLKLILCFVIVTTVTTTFDAISFINDVGSDICPYTNFCHTNATKKLKNRRLAPCCLPCSCGKDCWINGNCCPDASVENKQSSALNCKATLVKDLARYADNRLYDGYSYGIEAYRIIDSCPSTERNETLSNECKANNKTRLEQYQWVSDRTGRIFQNMYCAVCNNVSDVVAWDMQTSCDQVLMVDIAHVEQFLLSKNDCGLKVMPPKVLSGLTMAYRCFIPAISTCRAEYNQSIKTACQTYESPLIYRSKQVSLANPIYKNIYCFLCNNMRPETMEKVCQNITDDGRHERSDALSIILDYRKANKGEEKQMNGDCKVDEVYDKYKDRCLQLSCPFGSTPYRGSCETVALQTQHLLIQIYYNLQVLENSYTRLEFLQHGGKDTLFHILSARFLELISPHGLKCQVCSTRLRINNSTKDFSVALTFYTKPDCQLDSILKQSTNVLGKELKILNVTFYVKLDKRHIDTIHRYFSDASIIVKDAWCNARYRLTNEVICPAVYVNASEMIDKFKHSRKYSDSKRIVTEAANASTSTLESVCWDAYQKMHTSVAFSPNSYSGFEAILVMASVIGGFV